MAMKGTSHSSQLQDWSLTVRSFCVISRTFIVGVLLLCRDEISIFYRTSWLSLNHINKLDLWCKYNAKIQLIGLVGRMFTNGLGYLGSNPGCVIPKTLKMVLDTSLLNPQQYKVHIKGKVEQSREWCSALPYTLV